MKKNKNIITAILVFTLVATGIYSCSDEYLDETDNYNIDSQGYFNSEDDYYMALVGVYDLLQASYVNVLLGEIASDNTLCGGESATDVVGFQQIDDMGHTPVNSNLRDVWSWMFSGISRANYFLEFTAAAVIPPLRNEPSAKASPQKHIAQLGSARLACAIDRAASLTL